jgi:hypothetical protein
MGLLIDDRSDISKLERSHPGKAATYDRLRNEVNAPMHGVEGIDLRQSRREVLLMGFCVCTETIDEAVLCDAVGEVEADVGC